MAKLEVLIKIANLGSEDRRMTDKEGKSLTCSWTSRKRKIVW